MSISPIEVAAGIGIAREVVQLTGDVGRSLFRNLLQQREPAASSPDRAASSVVAPGTAAPPGSTPRSLAALSKSHRSISHLIGQFQTELSRVLQSEELPQDSVLRIQMDDHGNLRVTQGDSDTGEIQQAIRQSPLLTDLFRAIRLQATRSGQLNSNHQSPALELVAMGGKIHPLAVE
ncbi:MAG: hypothetical protein ABGZ17_24520 [Planctomycetaceae bacterium]